MSSFPRSSISRPAEGGLLVTATSWWKDPWFLAFTLILFLIGSAAFVHPKGNFDGLFYTALASGARTPQEQQQAGLAFDKAWQPDEVVSAYRDDVRSNASHFQQQLPFYSVKPLYVFLLFCGRHLGLGLRAGAFFSALGFVLLGLLVLQWLRHYYGSCVATLLAALLLLNPTLLQLVRWTSPDILAVLVVLAGVYVILEKQHTLPGCLLLLVSLWLRPEIIVFIGLALCALYLAKRLTLWQTAALSVLALGSYFFIGRHGYSFSILFYHSLIARLNAPAEAHIIFTRSMYLGALKSSLQSLAVGNPYLTMPFLLGAVTFIVAPRRDAWAYLSAAALLSSLILLIAYPKFEARYYLATMVFIPVLALLVQISRLLHKAAI